MNDGDGWFGGDLFLGMLLGALFAGGEQQPRAVGHHHGDHWHSHELPPGYHVHDGHRDGPIRSVPPTPEQLASEAQRRAERRRTWAAALAVVGVILMVLGAWWLGMTLLGAGALLSESVRAALGRTATAVREAWWAARELRRDRRSDPAKHRPPLPVGASSHHPFVVSGVEVAADGVGRLRVHVEGWSQVTSPAVHLEVVIWRAGTPVGEVSGVLTDLVAGAATSVVLHGNERYLGHDRVEVTSKEMQR
jgi:hypothetical protein